MFGDLNYSREAMHNSRPAVAFLSAPLLCSQKQTGATSNTFAGKWACVYETESDKHQPPRGPKRPQTRTAGFEEGLGSTLQLCVCVCWPVTQPCSI